MTKIYIQSAEKCHRKSDLCCRIFLPDCPLENAVDLSPVHDERGQMRRHHRVPAGRRSRQERAGVEHGANVANFKVEIIKN